MADFVRWRGARPAAVLDDGNCLVTGMVEDARVMRGKICLATDFGRFSEEKSRIDSDGEATWGLMKAVTVGKAQESLSNGSCTTGWGCGGQKSCNDVQCGLIWQDD